MNSVLRGSHAFALEDTQVMLVFAQGSIVGFLIAAPVGPIGLLCIRRSLQGGWRVGFASGLGAASADALYAAVAALGLTAVLSFLKMHALAFQIISMILLAALGIQAIASAFRKDGKTDPAANRMMGPTASSFLLTLVNPATVLSFAAAFTIIATRVGPLSKPLAVVFALGAFCGSAAWWLILSASVGAARSRLQQQALRWVNIGSGFGLIGFALLALRA